MKTVGQFGLPIEIVNAQERCTASVHFSAHTIVWRKRNHVLVHQKGRVHQHPRDFRLSRKVGSREPTESTRRPLCTTPKSAPHYPTQQNKENRNHNTFITIKQEQKRYQDDTPVAPSTTVSGLSLQAVEKHYVSTPLPDLQLPSLAHVSA